MGTVQFNKTVVKNYDLLVSTDGACKGNPGKGTWALVVFNKDTDELLGHKKGHKDVTTNNEMELKAILEAITWANKFDKTILIRSDSKYCIDGVTKWMQGWKNNYWKTNSNQKVKNLSLWRDVYHEWKAGSHAIEYVKGHSGDRHNDLADMYCNEEYVNVYL